jgi:hypothetical protein
MNFLKKMLNSIPFTNSSDGVDLDLLEVNADAVVENSRPSV